MSELPACLYCGEPLKPEAMRAKFNQLLHFECGFRMIAGSVGHITRTCSCYGGTNEDPPGMTLRQGARAALMLYFNEYHIEPSDTHS